MRLWFHKTEKGEAKETLKNRRDVLRENVAQMKQFRKTLLPHGLGIRTVEEDGNCLFRAVADQLYGSQDYHEHVRNKVCDYMQANGDFFCQFLTTERPFVQYVQDMRKDGTWAGNIELQAVSLAFHVNIRIHQLEEPWYDLCNFDDAEWIHLAFHDYRHYSSVRRLRHLFSNLPAKHREVPHEVRSVAGRELADRNKITYQQAMAVLNSTDYDWSRSLDYLGLICKHNVEVPRKKAHFNRAEKKELRRLEQFWSRNVVDNREWATHWVEQHRLSI
ncbi:hypothetical protein GpartN1_g6745.t1 [Galdieria partita]|uniref:OTU domain-containing protein n=1 Tax=Galdieria partita TaxID=83374 RepID=A0A9C7Q258_9RHOD|nr:hypothetical protein GpartN1_g6745.t1 [Galdieria partita]